MQTMSKFHLILLAGSAGVIIGFILFLGMGALQADVGAIVSLAFSLLIGGGLCWSTYWLLKRTFRSGLTSVNVYWLLATVVVGALTFFTIVAILDVGAGVGIRNWGMFSGLPEGNLLFASGAVGWTVLVMLGVIVATLLRNNALKHKEPKPPREPRAAKQPRSERPGRMKRTRVNPEVDDSPGAVEAMLSDLGGQHA